MRQQPALQRPLAAPHDVGDEVVEAQLRQPRPDARVVGRVVAREDQQLLDRRAGRRGRAARSTSSGVCRWVWCVWKAQYLQCETHVRDSDSVTLREKVTRRRTYLILRRRRRYSPAPMFRRPRHRRPDRSPPSRSLAGCAASGGSSDSRPDQDAEAAARLRAQRGPRRHLPGARSAATTRPRASTSTSSRPASRPTGSRRCCRGQEDMAIVDIHDLAIAQSKGKDVVGVMAIVQTPLAAVLAQPDVARPKRPRGPQGRRDRPALRRRGPGDRSSRATAATRPR